MKRVIIKLITCFFLVSAFLGGCGKVSLKNGTIESDTSYLTKGRFTEHVIDTSFIPGEYSVLGSYTGDDHYSFILQYYSALSYYSTDDTIFYFKVSADGIPVVSGGLELPITVNNYKASFNELCSDITIREENMSLYDNASVYYKNFKYESDGSFSAVCVLSASVYSDELGGDFSIGDRYLVKWDSDGRCISVSDDTEDDYSSYFSMDSEFIGKDGNSYKITSSGIIKVNSEGEYEDKFFDLLNSDINSKWIEYASVINTDSFCCIYVDNDGRKVLSCFTPDSGNSDGKKAIVIACTSIDNEFKSEVYAYNTSDNPCRIAVIDYSDMSTDYSRSEAWYLLKEDIAGGFSPDMILNTSGYDKSFIEMMSSEEKLSDLKDVILKDSDLDVTFSSRAKALFYSGDSVYAMIPAYYYRTVVGGTDKFNSSDTWDSEYFCNNVGSLASQRIIFGSDTRDNAVLRFLAYNGSEYVNYRECLCNFNSQEFIDYLNVCKDIPADIDEVAALTYSETNLGRVLLADMYCRHIGDMKINSTTALANEYIDLGFPRSISASGGVISTDDCYMILSANAHANECWQFIKHYLSHDYQENIIDGIPVTSAGYDAWVADHSPHLMNVFQASYFKDGIEYTVSMPDEIEAADILSHVEGCNTLAFSDYKIEQIVLEYAGEFFDGKITAEEAAKQIDAEVESYLAG